MIARKNTAVLKIIIVQAEISINNANCGKMLLLTVSSIMSLTLIKTRGQINKKENDPFVPAIKKVTHLFFFYCPARQGVVQLIFCLLTPVIVGTPPPTHFLLCLSSVKPLTSGFESRPGWFLQEWRAFISQWPHTPLVSSSGMHKKIHFVYKLVLPSLCWFYSVHIFISREPSSHLQLIAGMLAGWWLWSLSVSVRGDFGFPQTVNVIENFYSNYIFIFKKKKKKSNLEDFRKPHNFKNTRGNRLYHVLYFSICLYLDTHADIRSSFHVEYPEERGTE